MSKPNVAQLMGEYERIDFCNDVAAEYDRVKRPANDEGVMKCALSVVKHYALVNIEKDIGDKLTQTYEMYVMMWGERPTGPGVDASEWDATLDGEVAALFEQYVGALSSSWLGANSADTRLYEEGAVAKLARSYAAEVYKGATTGMSGPDILSAAGYNLPSIKGHLGVGAGWAAAEPTEAAAEPTEAGSSEDDDFLTSIGCAPSSPAGSAQGVVSDVPLPGERPKRSRSKKAEPSAPVVGDVGRALALLKDHGNVNDRMLSDGIGGSRATVNNYVNGKTPFVPSEEQRTFLRNTVWAHLTGLCEAMSLLDGVTYLPVIDKSEALAHEGVDV